jgi:hypothetical protein
MRSKMKPNTWMILLLCVLQGTALDIHSADSPKSVSGLIGTVLINIDNAKDCYDFSLSLADDRLLKLGEGKIVSEKKGDQTYVVCRGSSFHDNWKRGSGVQFLSDHEFVSVFGAYDFSELRDRMTRRNTNKCNPTTSFELKRKPKSAPDARSLFDLRVNEQRSRAVFLLYPGGPGFLIDVVKGEAVDTFCNENSLRNVFWDKSGRYVAYTRRVNNNEPETLVIIDTTTSKRILERLLESQVSSIAWSSSSNHIAVVNVSSRMGTWPWQLLMAVAGHPVPYNSFTLSVYDTAGKLLLAQNIMDNVTNGHASAVWVAR